MQPQEVHLTRFVAAPLWSADPDLPNVFRKPVPEGVEDLREIEKTVRIALENGRIPDSLYPKNIREALISLDVSYVTEEYVPTRLQDRDFLD